MITNERQYRITKAQVDRFQEALDRVEEEYRDQDPILQKAMRDQIESQLVDLLAELEEYEKIRASGGSTLDLRSIEQLPEALVWGRIARGLTQRELGELLGVSEQQVQRDESSGYARASFERIMEIARALGVDVTASVTLPSPLDNQAAQTVSTGWGQRSSSGRNETMDDQETGSARQAVGRSRV